MESWGFAFYSRPWDVLEAADKLGSWTCHTLEVIKCNIRALSNIFSVVEDGDKNLVLLSECFLYIRSWRKKPSRKEVAEKYIFYMKVCTSDVPCMQEAHRLCGRE